MAAFTTSSSLSEIKSTTSAFSWLIRSFLVINGISKFSNVFGSFPEPHRGRLSKGLVVQNPYSPFDRIREVIMCSAGWGQGFELFFSPLHVRVNPFIDIEP